MIRKSLIALAALAVGCSAQASTYDFSGTIDPGTALSGLNFSGSFSFDDSLLPSADGWLPLTALTLSFDGQTYTLATTLPDSAAVDFDTDGVTVTGVDAVWGNNINGVYISYGAGSPYLEDSAGNSGSYTITPAAAVPEPSSWLMGLAGLAVMGAMVSRRRAGK